MSIIYTQEVIRTILCNLSTSASLPHQHFVTGLRMGPSSTTPLPNHYPLPFDQQIEWTSLSFNSPLASCNPSLLSTEIFPMATVECNDWDPSLREATPSGTTVCPTPLHITISHQ